MKKRRILIAEDYLDNFLLLEAILREYPYELIHVEDGAKALEAVNNEKFDLLLIDVQMPIMNGLDFIREYKKTNNETPAIAQTAHAFDIDRKECLEAGFADYISKPINKKLLIDLLQKYLS